MKIIKIIGCKSFKIEGKNIYTINLDNQFLINGKILTDNKSGKFRISGLYDDKIVLFEENKCSTYIYNDKEDLIKRIDEYAIIIPARNESKVIKNL